MTPADLVDIAREGFILALILSLPVLAAVLISGLVMTLLQMFTKSNETAVSHVVRIGAVAVSLLITLPWIASRVVGFADRIWSMIQAAGL